MTDMSLLILNDGEVGDTSDLQTEDIDKNIRTLITKLKGKYMNEGK